MIISFAWWRRTIPSLLVILLHSLNVFVKASGSVLQTHINRFPAETETKYICFCLAVHTFPLWEGKEVKWPCSQVTGTRAVSPTIEGLVFDINSWSGLGQLTLSTPLHKNRYSSQRDAGRFN